MLRADNVNRREYAYDPGDESKGVRIYTNMEGRDENDQRIIVPQQVVVVAMPAIKWEFLTGNSGTVRCTIHVAHFEKPDTDYVQFDSLAPSITVLAKMNRTRQILMRGTLYDEDRVADHPSENGAVIDPYATPLLPDGTYDPSGIVRISEKPPEITYGVPRAIPRKQREGDDESKVDRVKDVALLYSVLATYEIDITNRDTMSAGG